MSQPWDLGASNRFPAELQVGKYVDARIKEILGLQHYIDQPRQGQLASQQIPRHLRRRAVSHNPNRLPRRLRAKHIHQKVKSEGPSPNGPSPRPSRKYRRRPKRLLTEYNRRQKRHVWLETHIWHAKRFHMTHQWGYQIPEYPNDKHFRAAYRAVAQKCLMRDVSYTACLELQGPVPMLGSGLKKIVDPQSNPWTALDNLAGIIEGHAVLFQPGEHPRQVIGRVSFIWRPVASTEDGTTRTLWIWSHPAIHESVKGALVQVFGLVPTAQAALIVEATDDGNPAKKSKPDVNGTKLAPRNVPFVRVPEHHHLDGHLFLRDLKDTLNRFRLLGPKSPTVLSRTLQVSTVNRSVQAWAGGWTAEALEPQQSAWLEVAQHAPAEIRSGAILGLVVRDPRILLPPKRDGIQFPDQIDLPTPCLFKPKPDLAQSPLWDPKVRDDVTQSKCPDHAINEKRGQHLIPGTPLALSEEESRVPVLLVQQSGMETTHFGAGWDLIMPAGWGISFWMNLNFNGARVGGLREENHLQLEQFNFSELARSPDSQAGQTEAVKVSQICRELYFRFPPDKRSNFLKLGIISPFTASWSALIRNYLDDDLTRKRENSRVDATKFFVIRDSSLLKGLKDQLEAKQPMKYPHRSIQGLVPVELEIRGKGTLGQFSVICCPNSTDSYSASEDAPKESAKEDKKMEVRKKLKEKHTVDKARLRKRWKEKKDRIVQMRAESILNKTNLDEEAIETVKREMESLKVKREEEIGAFNAKMNDLWLSDATDVKNHCSRTLMGYSLEAGYSYRLGKVIGVGYVSVLALYEYSLNVSQWSGQVLTRETDNDQYRWAQVRVKTSQD